MKNTGLNLLVWFFDLHFSGFLRAPSFAGPGAHDLSPPPGPLLRRHACFFRPARRPSPRPVRRSFVIKRVLFARAKHDAAGVLIGVGELDNSSFKKVLRTMLAVDPPNFRTFTDPKPKRNEKNNESINCCGPLIYTSLILLIR